MGKTYRVRVTNEFRNITSANRITAGLSIGQADADGYVGELTSEQLDTLIADQYVVVTNDRGDILPGQNGSPAQVPTDAVLAEQSAAAEAANAEAAHAEAAEAAGTDGQSEATEATQGDGDSKDAQSTASTADAAQKAPEVVKEAKPKAK